MAEKSNKTTYIPGMYKGRVKTGVSPARMAENYLRQLAEKRTAIFKEKTAAAKTHDCISFSRKIGVGALEIADMVGKRLDIPVVDREILEHIAGDQNLNRKTLERFDERYPGAMQNFGAMLFGEKSITMGDYMRHLVSAVFSLVESGPTLFVGRGTHLMLPRDRVLAVRFIASKDYRVNRVAGIIGVSEREAAKYIDGEDKVQKDFFAKNFKRKDASPYEFDLVVNRDYLGEAEWAADLVVRAYQMKFGVK